MFELTPCALAGRGQIGLWRSGSSRFPLGRSRNTTSPCSWILLCMKADRFCCLQGQRVFSVLSPNEGAEEDGGEQYLLPPLTVMASLRTSQLEAVVTSSG